MLWLKMLGVALRLAWPYLLMPWRSPLLRWRIETYGLLDEQGKLLSTSAIGFKEFFHFITTNRRALFSFLRWAATLEGPPRHTANLR